MWPLVLLVPLVVAYVVGSERPQTQTQSPEPPTGVRVQGSVVSWSPAPPLSRTYSVQAWSLDTKQWRDTSCVRTPDTSCDVAATMKKADFGCARLRVHAHEHNLTSRPVEACSPRGSYCSPEVKLSSQPDTLTVHLSGNTELVRNHGSAVQHMIYYGEDGKPPKKNRRSPSSVDIKNLEGQRYCVTVFFAYYNTCLGPPSCDACQDIPQSVPDPVAVSAPGPDKVAVSVGLSVLALLLLLVLVLEKNKIKKCLKSPERPQCLREPFSVRSEQVYKFSEERWNHISQIVPLEDRYPPSPPAPQ